LVGRRPCRILETRKPAALPNRDNAICGGFRPPLPLRGSARGTYNSAFILSGRFGPVCAKAIGTIPPEQARETDTAWRPMSLLRQTFDWKVAGIAACASFLCVVTVSLASAGVPKDDPPATPTRAAWPATIEHAAPGPTESSPPIGSEFLQGVAVALFIAATAAGPVWLISTAHHPHPRARCSR
jgi:hypothetical protein